MTRRLVSSGSTFEQQIGYSRAVVDSGFVFVSGATGYDYETMSISDDITEQAEQCFRNIEQALIDAGSAIDRIARVTYILSDRDDFEACWPSLRRYFGSARPAATMMATGLSDSRMKVEIEVTALMPGPDRPSGAGISRVR